MCVYIVHKKETLKISKRLASAAGCVQIVLFDSLHFWKSNIYGESIPPSLPSPSSLPSLSTLPPLSILPSLSTSTRSSNLQCELQTHTHSLSLSPVSKVGRENQRRSQEKNGGAGEAVRSLVNSN